MSQDWIGADPKSLPRSFRGYSPRATQELFKRVALEYGELAREHRRLAAELKEPAPAPSAPAPFPAPAPAPEPAPPPRPARADPDEEAHALLAAAYRAVRDMRESARAECEQALKKAKSRAAEIELEAKRAGGDARAVLDAAAVLRSSLQEALTRMNGEVHPGAAADDGPAQP